MISIFSPRRPAAAPVLLAALVPVLALTACGTTSSPPAVDLPARFINGAPAAQATAADVGAWWQRFDDALLRQLVADAVANGHDLRVAVARVEVARAGVQAATGAMLPGVSAVGARSVGETGYSVIARQRLPNTDITRAGLNASWEVDLFGALRAARGAAAADLLAADHARRGVLLSVAAEVARHYVTLRSAQERSAIVQDLVRSQRETLRLTEKLRAAGQGSDFDVDRALADLAATQAELPRLDALAAASRHRLATLTGQPAGTLDAALATTGPALTAPDVAPGQPIELPQRRPDVMAAEAQLRAAASRLDEAKASRFPRLVLNALFGTQWTDINALDIGRARFANVGATLALPLFAGGQIDAAIDAAGAREREALASYERSVLQALEDVESALAVLAGEARRGADLDQSVAARERALGRALALYRAGQADLLVVLDVERGLLAAQLARAAHHTDRLLATVHLYRALGGGWEVAEPARPPAAPVANAPASSSRVSPLAAAAAPAS
ncbi:MAG: efflux transporter outer membrane subunit [Betaproteobacteria bacterium]